MALLIYKYRSSINWSVFISRAREWGKGEEILLISKLINKIYNDYIPQEVINTLLPSSNIKIEDNTIKTNTLPTLLNMDPGDIINLSTCDLLIKILLNTSYLGSTIDCPFLSEKENKIESFYINEYDYSASSISGTYMSKQRATKSINYRGMGEICWDQSNLYLKLEVKIEEDFNQSILFGICYSDYTYKEKYKCFIPSIVFNLDSATKNI